MHFAWAAYTAQKDGTPVLRLTFRGQHGKTYFWNVIDTETGWQSKSMLPFDYRFNDVLDENAWYYDAVYAAWDAGLMNGVGRDYFAPNATLDRATLATVLYREAGEPAAKGMASFTDIAEGQWYTDAVNWAAEQGVVNGYPDGTFRPEAPITRQEMGHDALPLLEAAGRQIRPEGGRPCELSGSRRGRRLGAGGHELDGAVRASSSA